MSNVNSAEVSLLPNASDGGPPTSTWCSASYQHLTACAALINACAASFCRAASNTKSNLLDFKRSFDRDPGDLPGLMSLNMRRRITILIALYLKDFACYYGVFKGTLTFAYFITEQEKIKLNNETIQLIDIILLIAYAFFDVAMSHKYYTTTTAATDLSYALLALSNINNCDRPQKTLRLISGFLKSNNAEKKVCCRLSAGQIIWPTRAMAAFFSSWAGFNFLKDEQVIEQKPSKLECAVYVTSIAIVIATISSYHALHLYREHAQQSTIAQLLAFDPDLKNPVKAALSFNAKLQTCSRELEQPVSGDDEVLRNQTGTRTRPF